MCLGISVLGDDAGQGWLCAHCLAELHIKTKPLYHIGGGNPHLGGIGNTDNTALIDPCNHQVSFPTVRL